VVETFVAARTREFAVLAAVLDADPVAGVEIVEDYFDGFSADSSGAHVTRASRDEAAQELLDARKTLT
jgi:hypothetical protein